MSQLEFAIELGTTNTVIYKRGSGIVLCEPSLIALSKENKKTVVKAVGTLAKKMLGKTSSATTISNPIEEGVIKDKELAYSMLKHFMKKIITEKFVKPKIRMLFVIPCGLNIREKAEYKSLGYRLGAGKVDFVESVIAALVGAGVSTENPSGVMSLNLGGGTVNVGAVSLNTIINGYTISIGGAKMDEAIKRYVEEAYELEISNQTAEKIKKEIGSLYIHDTSNMEVNGIDTATKAPKQEVVFSTNIRPAIEYYFQKISAAVEDILNNCSPDIVADIANNGVYVTGGLANLTGIENYLKKRLRLPIYVVDEPEEAVIIGAGKLLSDKRGLNSIIREN
ncbi:MAG: rod shape-determining protein [Spirochaetales bacterium]